MNTEDDLFDIIIYGKCRCGAVGEPEHSCPYDEDVNNDPNSICNCCKQCTEACADDI